jgi:hyperosmotically inducible periplasmic protein
LGFSLEETLMLFKSMLALLSVNTVFLTAIFAADHKKDHVDAFLPGDVGNNRIAREVRHELVMLPYYGVFDDLAFRVDGTTVTLLGAVTRPTLKSEAENVTKQIEGVTQVKNEITVLPLSPMDDTIRRAAYRAIFGDPALSIRYGYRALPSIHIIVDNGRITLEGMVANLSDKDLVQLRANSVENVFSVVNELQIEAK